MSEGTIEVRSAISEQQFRQFAGNKGLDRAEWECLRQYYGLSYDQEFVARLIMPDRYVIMAMHKIRGNPRCWQH